MACGKRHEDVPTAWARWMGAHEIGRAFAGRPLPDWCPDCILALARPSQPKRKRTSTVTPRGNPTRPTLFDAD